MSNRAFQTVIAKIIFTGLTLCAHSISYGSLLSEAQTQQAKSPGMQMRTSEAQFNLLSGDIDVGQTELSGALPYRLQYRGVYRANLAGINELYDPYISTGGWTDNYNNYVRKVEATHKKGALFIVRLPGQSQDYSFYVDYATQVIWRIYTSNGLCCITPS